MHKPVHYKPKRGGHAPGYLRDAFASWIDDDGMKSETCEYDGERVPVGTILGMLWNCTDIMPGDMCDQLDLPHGSSYAIGARAAKRDLPIYRARKG